jgi:hypothetical protein
MGYIHKGSDDLTFTSSLAAYNDMGVSFGQVFTGENM